MTPEMQALRDAAIAAAAAKLKPVQFNVWQSLLMAWQVYKLAKAAPVVPLDGGPGHPIKPK